MSSNFFFLLLRGGGGARRRPVHQSVLKRRPPGGLAGCDAAPNSVPGWVAAHLARRPVYSFLTRRRTQLGHVSRHFPVGSGSGAFVAHFQLYG